MRVLLILTWCMAALVAAERPNIVYILADDLGYGDVSCLNPEGKIATPHIDRLAAEGMAFIDAHTSSSVCTPTRYNVLTGRYSWRTHLKTFVLNGYGEPLISEDTQTIGGILQAAGYDTAMIGKWHLGMGLPITGPGTGPDKKQPTVDYSAPLTRTPTSNGFDYFWGIVASLDFPPYNYIENERYLSTNVKWGDRKTLGIQSGFRAGPIADNFDPFTTLDEFCDRSAAYIRNHSGEAPFFLYLPLTSPHTPIIPTEEWRGKSGIGAYGDFVMQTDAGVGRVLAAIDDKGIADNTIVIFTADNGCSGAAGFPELLAQGHNPSGQLRGHKTDIWDGGHRVPHLVRWPAAVAAGSTCDRLTVLGDIVATAAELVGHDLAADEGVDSRSFLASLRGLEPDPLTEHEAIIHHSVKGMFAIRTPRWMLAFCPGSGGGSAPKDDVAREQGLPEYQLYDMDADLAQQTNLIAQEPSVVAELSAMATRIVQQGRSTPGPAQANDGDPYWSQLVWIEPPAGWQPAKKGKGKKKKK
ncbi:MAG: sulfatase family protein [Planctomycetota bacterium]|jgi:arylsulfatase A-like enzyme